jgi:ribonuclease G
MAKEICISSTPHETRLAILEDDQLTEIYYERENEYTLAGSIYKGRVTRVLPGMQSAFVDLGLERDAFLYVTDFMEEQEDSADFEKVPAANGGGNNGRKEAQPAREPQAAREPRDNRGDGRGESRGEGRGDHRAARAPIAIEPEIRQASSSEIQSGPSRVASEGGVASGEDDLQGTRRWRGRRGRRRGGRSGGPRETGAIHPPAHEPEPGASFDSDFQIEVGSIEVGHGEIETGPVVYEEAAAHGGGQAVFSDVSIPRAPQATHSVPAAMQPIVLPGESLSRYGAKPAPSHEARPAAAIAAPVVSASSYKPKTLVEALPGWDGGAELPGESLSRYHGKPAKVEAPIASEPSQSNEIVQQAWHVQASEPAASFDEQVPVETARESEAKHAMGQHPVATEPDGATESAAEHTGAVEETPEQTVAAAPVLEQHEVVAEPAQVEEVRQEETVLEREASLEQEAPFEPEHASASYRIDPVAPSEYRFSPVVEEELEAPVESAEVVAPEVAGSEEAAAPEAVGNEPTAQALAAVEPEVVHAQETVDAVESAVVVSAAVEEQAAPEEITAASYEDAVAAAPQVDTVPIDTVHIDTGTVESADPLLADEALSAAAVESPQTFETEFVEEDEFADGPRGFAPGAGTLEEEVIEEEEYDSEPLRAFADEHDMDDLEEETLDNLSGAEISEMVRDAHLEKRIGASPDGLIVEGDGEGEETEYGEAEGELDDDDEDEGEDAVGEQSATSAPAPARRDGRTDDGRRGGRGPRRRGRPNGGGGGGSRRANSQLSDLPIISELLKQGQEILVQIAKEPIAKKGARITSHIALPGRFLVFMPTVNHVGVSRKISSDEERQRLKRILISEKGAASGGFIVRTAADGAGEDDLRADIRFLISLWNDIKQRADDGKAPALIYHDLNLIERVLRDQVSANFSTIWVDNEAEFERILRFLQRFEPSLVRRVKLYTKETPLFEQFGIQDEIGKALKSKVWLKSGGSIVINQTEALVAIDINTGKYVGKTARLEDTILRTNLDAIPEIVRQIRLRDLGGIIVIDFIDMDDRKNRHRVMAALEEELKSDRAPSKVLQFNDFGLVAITRKRVKQSLERTLSVQCEVCAGTGMVKSPTTVCNEIYTELRKMQKHLERADVLLRVNPEVVKTLKAGNAKWLNELEEMTGKTIIVKSDPALHPEQFDIH